MIDRAELVRLHLRLERAVSTQRQLRSLVIAADATLVAVRRDLRNAKARLARAAAATRGSIAKERYS